MNCDYDRVFYIFEKFNFHVSYVTDDQDREIKINQSKYKYFVGHLFVSIVMCRNQYTY